MKNVLVLYYTQSGQLKEIAKSITTPLEENKNIAMTFCEIKMKKPFPFPWNKAAFFDAFPESFLEVPAEVLPIDPTISQTKFDLIILAYQVWFLSISIPVNSFLNSNQAKKLFKDTPVVTVIGCRNMWVGAQEKMKKHLENLQAKLVGNIVLVDRAPNLISVITIVQWMFSGKKKKYLGVFPKPGVSENDIEHAQEFGFHIKQALSIDNFELLQSHLINERAVEVNDYLLKAETKGARIFKKWARFIITKKRSRKLWLKAFNVYLFLAIWIISPIVYILHLLTFLFTKNARIKRKKYYQSV
ncbi:dialkylrecorsinol condensing enzyme DarA [uncultured Planktosalinus sp.]|uniref:dialkylrecorsinol condensing enzyme DarA n=1 Tax=uncultured Planktosalinus sp. TaxID=1810935 RepID=UPI0030DB1341